MGDLYLRRMEAPGADAAEKVGVAELVLAGHRVRDVTEGAVVGEDPVRSTRVDHPRDGVVPQVLLVRRALALDLDAVRGLPGVAADEVAGVSAADPGRL